MVLNASPPPFSSVQKPAIQCEMLLSSEQDKEAEEGPVQKNPDSFPCALRPRSPMPAHILLSLLKHMFSFPSFVFLSAFCSFECHIIYIYERNFLGVHG